MEILTLIKGYLFSGIMASFLAYIAYQQFLVNKNKLKLELYSKRFEIYTITLQFYQELITNGATSETHKEFIKQKEAAKFLFSEDLSIYSLLNKMHEKSFKVKAFKSNRSELEKHPEQFDKVAKESLEVVNWLEVALKELNTKLNKFLSFKGSV